MTQLLQNAACGTVMILAVVLLRRILKDRLVPGARLALWAACLFRLLTPAAPECVFCLWGLPRLFETPKQPAAPAPSPVGYAPVAGAAPAPVVQPEPGISWETVLLVLWLAVGAALALRYVVSWSRTRRAVSCAIPVERDDHRYAPLPRWAQLREGPMEGAPLTFGTVRPTVVLSPGLEGPELECVLAHEGVHARRRDNLWHYAMALALVVHWWNPAVWLMSRFLRRDIELSCDRAALKRLGTERRAEYAQALVSLATQTEGPAFCHTFGRKAAEERILSVMKFKKTSVIGVIFSLALVLAVTVAFASEPKESQPDAVTFHGNTFSRSELSQETLDWLDWYLALPEQEQLAISYVPAELRGSQTPETQDADVYDNEKVGSTVMVPNPDRTEDVQSDLPEVDPDDVDLSTMKEWLAQQVSEGKLTQAEADEMLADVESMLEKARRGEVKLFWYPDKDGNEFLCASGVGTMYYRAADGGLLPLDPGTSVSGYVVSDLPTFDEDGNSVSADGGIIGTRNDPSASPEPSAAQPAGEVDSKFYDYQFVSGNEVRTASGSYPICTDAGCTAAGTHCHMNGQVVPVSYQDPNTGSTTPPAAVPDPGPAPSSAASDSKYNAAPASSAAPSSTGYPVCTVSGCTLTGHHTHNGTTYCGGSNHHGSTCDGTCGYNASTGYPVCTVSGCTLTGHHTHNGTTYCGGSNHHGSTCDGTCGYYAQQTVPTPSSTTSGGHHGSGHHSDSHH